MRGAEAGRFTSLSIKRDFCLAIYHSDFQEFFHVNPGSPGKPNPAKQDYFSMYFFTLNNESELIRGCYTQHFVQAG